MWQLEVTPEGAGAVVLTLPAGRDCAEAGAICSAGGQPLYNAVALSIAGPPAGTAITGEGDSHEAGGSAASQEAGTAALTATFAQVPDAHDGQSAFTLEVHLSAAFPLSYRTMRDAVLDVRGGLVTRARRLVPGSDQAWELTVVPDAEGAVELVLPVHTDCAAPGALCLADGTPLSAEVTATVPGPLASPPPPVPVPAPLTATFAQVPAAHNGVSAFTVEVHLSTDLSLSYRTMRDAVLDVSGGTVTRARRLVPGSDRGWEITVVPAADGVVELVLPVPADCGVTGALCLADGTPLAAAVTATVPGPADG